MCNERLKTAVSTQFLSKKLLDVLIFTELLNFHANVGEYNRCWITFMGPHGHCERRMKKYPLYNR